MKILEIIWASLLVILCLGLAIWQVSINSPAFPVCFIFVMCFMAIILLCHVLKEFYEEKKQKKVNN